MSDHVLTPDQVAALQSACGKANAAGQRRMVSSLARSHEALRAERDRLRGELSAVAQLMELLRSDPSYQPPGNTLSTIHSIEAGIRRALNEEPARA